MAQEEAAVISAAVRDVLKVLEAEAVILILKLRLFFTSKA